jgi:hypothetical protein
MPGDQDRDGHWSVKYRLTPRDVRAISRMNYRRNPRAPIYLLVIMILLGAGLGWLIGAVAHGDRLRASAVGATVALAGSLLFAVFAEGRWVAYARRTGMFGEQTLTLGQDAFDWSHEDGRTSSTPWTNVTKLGMTPTYFVIALKDDSGSMVVPLTAFRSEAFASLFLSVATHWHRRATTSELLDP